MSELHSINNERRLYVLKAGKGFTCLGFEYAESRRVAVLKWLGETAQAVEAGTPEHYEAYAHAMERGAHYNAATRKRCDAELTPELIGLEGYRVEVRDKHGETRRFIVGKSTGWMPCHLEIARRNSHGGPAVTGAPFKSVCKLYKVR